MIEMTEEEKETIEENTEEERKKETEVRGVLFVPHTNKSELSKRIRKKLKDMESISCLRVKIVERAGEKIVDALHKSNPWEDVNCGREDCIFCNGNNEKMMGKCKQRGVVYETLCMLCEKKRKQLEDAYGDEETGRIENNGEKRKREDMREIKERQRLKEESKQRTIHNNENPRTRGTVEPTKEERRKANMKGGCVCIHKTQTFWRDGECF